MLCETALIIVLCIVIICFLAPDIRSGFTEDYKPTLFDYEVIEPHEPLLSGSYVNEDWYDAGDDNYKDDMSTKYVSLNMDNQYSSDNGKVPITADVKEGWYDMNRLGDHWKSNCLESKLNDIMHEEQQWQSLVHESELVKTMMLNKMTRDKKMLSNKNNNVKDSFGGRSALEWNEIDYPIITSNGLDMTNLFPQGVGDPAEVDYNKLSREAMDRVPQ